MAPRAGCRIAHTGKREADGALACGLARAVSIGPGKPFWGQDGGRVVGQREDRRMGVYAPQLQKGDLCLLLPPTSVGSSSVGPFRFLINSSKRIPALGRGHTC